MRKRYQVIVEGRVQGVCFRACTRDEARRLHLGGWVRNRTDGSVEAVIEGEEGATEEMLQWFQRGSPYAKVAAVRVSEEPAGEDTDGFEIVYG